MKLFTPYMSPEAVENATRVLNSGQLAEGEEVKLFEHEVRETFGLQNVAMVNSGTSALELAYEILELDSDDEVITPVLTCTATNLPLVRRGVNLVFADIDDDLNISIEDVKKKITPRTKAIVFVHFGGNNRGLVDLIAIGRERGIAIIEDAAQALGSDYWGHADFTAVSLQAIKLITSGDGGFLVCKSTEDHEKAKRLRWFGYDREKKQQLGDTDVWEAGFKYHMNNINAAIGRGNLAHIGELVEHRKKLAEVYKSYGLFAHAWLAGGFTEHYEALKELMRANDIEIGQHHYRNDKYTVFKGAEADCPNMDRLDNTYFFVPYHHKISTDDAHKIGRLCYAFNRKGG
jgi:dTDP-4-amino-4,6-dideoxygalactose transaminase